MLSPNFFGCNIVSKHSTLLLTFQLRSLISFEETEIGEGTRGIFCSEYRICMLDLSLGLIV